jgi:selenocysteine lyase/cysteine desulfurase
VTATSGRAAAPPAAYDVEALRAAEFPWTAETLYLNNASTGPIPERTRRALDAFNRQRAQPFGLTDDRLFAIFDRSRRLAARLVNADPAEIGLATNTSWGINLAAAALPLEPGDVVLVSDREFPANVYPWLRQRERGVVTELVPPTAEGWPDEARLLERLDDPRVRVLAVSLVQFSNGYTVDLARLSEACRARGIYLVVDAIQGVGQLPVDVRAVPVDVLACGAQKWLLSPWGSGFVYVRRELVERLAPPMVSWMAFEGTDDFSRLVEYGDALRADARRFEFITLPYQDFEGMNASIELLLELGVDAVRAHLARLHAPVLEWAARRGVRVASPVGPHGSGILCLALPNAAAVNARLREARVVASVREGAIRLSPHCYNTVGEMERLVELLERHADLP